MRGPGKKFRQSQRQLFQLGSAGFVILLSSPAEEAVTDPVAVRVDAFEPCGRGHPSRAGAACKE
jgi:hypothetical protein